MADWTGKTLGRVQINDLVARGGMAEIYTGIHETHGLVAVKVMRGLLEHDEHQLIRFKREAEVIGELHHPYIVRILDFAVADETPCMVMDYIPGPSLAVYMRELHNRDQQIPVALVAQILRPVASALDYAHSRGIIHRDIKPANILLRSPTHDIHTEQPLPADVEPVLTDFGLVRLLDSTLHTTAGNVSGTPTYMSPEQARGDPVDKRTDLYSLGIVLYEMLTGQVPFHSDSTFGMLMKHITEPPPPIKGISPDLQALLDRALAKDPDLRFQSGGEMADEFIAIFNGQTATPSTLHLAKLARKHVEELKTPKRIPVAKPPARYRWFAIAAAVLAVSLLAFLLFQFVRPSDPNVSVGRLQFGDFSGVLDEVRVTLNSAKPPGDGYHYETWLVSDDGAVTRKLGTVTFNAAGVGQLTLLDPGQANFLANFDRVLVSRERDDATASMPSAEVVYSSVFPPQALAPLRNLLVSHENTPDNLALIQGLWYYSGSYVNISINGYDVQGEQVVGLRQAFESGDESTVRKRTEEIINQIVGASSGLHLDHDGNGTLDNPADGFGSFPNDDSPGYLQETLVQVKLAVDAADSTPNIRASGENVQVCIQNMDGWLERILELALQLKDAPFGPDMEPVIAELETLGDMLVRGADSDQDGLIEPLPGECGADSAYEFAYNMADMPLYPGENRVPPSGK
jgi:serine/threonine protein kinase